MHPSAVNVADTLRALGVAGQVRELPEPAPTAAIAAAQLGVEVGAIANSLVFRADDAPLLVLTSGAHRVDTSRVAALTGVASVGRADPEFVRAATGQVIGGVAPVGHPQPLRTARRTSRGNLWRLQREFFACPPVSPKLEFPDAFSHCSD